MMKKVRKGGTIVLVGDPLELKIMAEWNVTNAYLVRL